MHWIIEEIEKRNLPMELCTGSGGGKRVLILMSPLQLKRRAYGNSVPVTANYYGLAQKSNGMTVAVMLSLLLMQP